MNWLRRRIARLLRLPEPPTLPGPAVDVKRFRAAPAYYHLRRLAWGVEQFGTLAGIWFGLAVISRWVPDFLAHWAMILELVGVGFWVLQMPITYAVVSLDYENRWYLVSGRSLRIREGTFRVKEQTLTFANIQNLTLKQGPIQRLFGICDLEVHTAGGGKAGDDASGTTGHHTGRLKGVANGEQIRSLILGRVREAAEAGEELDLLTPDLGGARDRSPEAIAGDLLAEVRGLRRELVPPG